MLELRIQRHDFVEVGVSFGKRRMPQISHSYKLSSKIESWLDTTLGVKWASETVLYKSSETSSFQTKQNKFMSEFWNGPPPQIIRIQDQIQLNIHSQCKMANFFLDERANRVVYHWVFYLVLIFVINLLMLPNDEVLTTLYKKTIV